MMQNGMKNVVGKGVWSLFDRLKRNEERWSGSGEYIRCSAGLLIAVLRGYT